MSIIFVDQKNSHGLQVSVTRSRVTRTKFFAFEKHGGVRKTYALARVAERALIAEMGPSMRATKSRSPGCYAVIPGKSNTSGVVGVRAYYRRGHLYFFAQWSVYRDGKSKVVKITRSPAKHGLLVALQQVLDARAEHTGQPSPSAARAWASIRKTLDRAGNYR